MFMDKPDGLLYNSNEVSLVKKKIVWGGILCCAIAIIVLSVVVLTGIGQQNKFRACADDFFDALKTQDYKNMYSLFTPTAQSNITLENVEKYYAKVYDMLEVEEVSTEITEVVQQGQECIFNYKLVLKSSKYGVMQYDSSLTVQNKLNFHLIDWTPSNVVPGMNYYDNIYKRTIKGVRGEIFDCNGSVLIKNAYAVTVYFYLGKTPDFESSASALAMALDLDSAVLLADMNKAKANGNDTVVAAVYIPGELSVEKEEAALAVEGVRVDRNSITPIRQAVYGSAAAHLIGYSTPVTQEDRTKEKYAGLSIGTRVGRTGMEYIYDDTLRGEDGAEIYLLSADASKKTVLYRKEATAGLNVLLTIDINLQLTAEKKMQETYSASGSVGAVVVNDPATGAIKAIASYPSFDLNIYAPPTPKAEASGLVDDKSLPLLNRATQGLYAPGSICKTMSAIAGLETNTVTIDTAFPYESQIVKVTNTTDGWRPAGSNWSHMIIREHMKNSAAYGALNMNRALVFSDNIYFGWMGMQMGADGLIDWFERFGMGEQVPFELSVKKSQISNDPENAKLYSNKKFLADTTVGHGELLVTPLQLSVIYSLYGNQGTMMQPYCLQSLCSTDEMGNHKVVSQTETNVYKQNVCSVNTVNIISESLKKVTVDGTGKKANVKGMTFIAKTGTAQKSEDEEVGWMAGYIVDGGTNYSVMVCTNGPRNATGEPKTAVAKEIFNYLKTPEA